VTYTSDRDANSELAIGRADGTAFLPAPSDGWDGDAAWSPDGRRLVFVSDRTGDDELWAVDADGGTLEQLTRHAGTTPPRTGARTGSCSAETRVATRTSGSWTAMATTNADS
jgi:TolB protein